MKLSNPFPSYAQYNEDVILLALLSDVEGGYYVDVGANYPIVDSVTKIFYENGWRGINIEPIPSICKMLEEDRPNDINLNIGVGGKEGHIDFYENETVPGHSSFDKNNVAVLDSDKIQNYKVEVKTLSNVFKENRVKNIHFIKIDVEGFEDEVIAGNDWSIYRPEVICIESSYRKTPWQRMLLDNKYKLFINDGLNEYYVAEESWYRTEGFADKVVLLDHKSLKKHQYDAFKTCSKQLKKVTDINQVHFDLVQQLRADNEKLYGGLSLKGISFLRRLKRSVYGLTIDWIKYKIDKISKKSKQS